MSTKSHASLAVLSHSQLLNRFEDLVHRDRRCTAEMLGVLAEIDDRKLWAAQACSSMFAFCVERFCMSEAVAAKRIGAARTARRFPVIFAMVARGELHLCGVHQLGAHLTESNHQALLDRAKHKSSREIEVLVAQIAPRPDVPSRIRTLPRSCTAQTESSTGLTIGSESTGLGEREIAVTARRTFSPPAVLKPVVPLSPRRYKLEVTIDQATHDKLRMLQDLLSRQHPNADPAAIVSRALGLLLVETLKKKAAITDRPRGGARSSDKCGKPRGLAGRADVVPVASAAPVASATPATPATSATPAAMAESAASSRPDGPPHSRAIPAAIRRKVWHRDDGRCAFVDEHGRRCCSKRAVEYHHIRPYGKGGAHEPDNIALRCAAHNQYQADLDFGRDFMNARRQSNRPRGLFEIGQ